MPSLARTFGHAVAVTPFIRVPRLQFSTRRMSGSAWIMLPHAAEFIDPWLSSGMVLTTAMVVRLGELLARAARDRPIAAAALAPLEHDFRTEARHVRRIVDSCLRSLHDPRLLSRALAIYRLSVMLDGLRLSRRDEQSATATVWAAGRPELEPLVRRAHAFFVELSDNRPVHADVLAELDAILHDNDPFGFFTTRMGRLRDDGIYVVSVWRMLDLLVRTDVCAIPARGAASDRSQGAGGVTCVRPSGVAAGAVPCRRGSSPDSYAPCSGSERRRYSLPPPAVDASARPLAGLNQRSLAH
jgi:hypothetical protein